MNRLLPPTTPRAVVETCLILGFLFAGSRIGTVAGWPWLASLSRGSAIVLAFGLGGWVLLWIVSQAERLISALERISEALGKPAETDGRSVPLFGTQPAGPVTAALPIPSQRLDELKAALEAARAANDPERVLQLREELLPLLDPQTRGALDRDLGGWLIRLIQRRLVAGNLTVEIVSLAGRVAAALGSTQEGASLRASLPTLRRGAGLCPRCGEPYPGIDDACPKCLGPQPVFAGVSDNHDTSSPELGSHHQTNGPQVPMS